MNILIIDDEEGLRKGIIKRLTIEGFDLFEAANSDEAMKIIASHQITIILLDLRLGEEDGLEVLKRIKQTEPEIRVIMLTGYGTIKNSVSCIQAGASNYLTKPIDMETLITTIESEAEKFKLYEENIALKQSLKDLTGGDALLQKEKSLPSKIEFIINKIKDSNVSILITGETGTGKEITAKKIHFSSSYSQKPFIGLNCSAFNENLIESELFGHEKGAFTGAAERKKGRFEIAGDGTLFLDEIGDMPMSMQTKLLRVLEERTFERVGSSQKIKTNCRIIAATNKNLKRAIEENRFREDLYYRLNVIEIALPPLKKRVDEIPFLVEQFIEAANLEYGKSIKSVSPEQMDLLNSYSWPGNIRQLKNIITNAVLLSDGEMITSLSLPMFENKTANVVEENQLDLKAMMDNEAKGLEEKIISAVLSQENRNITNAAQRLGISRKTLYKKIESYNL